MHSLANSIMLAVNSHGELATTAARVQAARPARHGASTPSHNRRQRTPPNALCAVFDHRELILGHISIHGCSGLVEPHAVGNGQAHFLLKKEVIFIVASAWAIFTALPLLVALLVPAFFAGVAAFFARDVFGDGNATGLLRLACGSDTAVPPSACASLRSRLILLGLSVTCAIEFARTGIGALVSVPPTRSVVSRFSLMSCCILTSPGSVVESCTPCSAFALGWSSACDWAGFRG